MRARRAFSDAFRVDVPSPVGRSGQLRHARLAELLRASAFFVGRACRHRLPGSFDSPSVIGLCVDVEELLRAGHAKAGRLEGEQHDQRYEHEQKALPRR